MEPISANLVVEVMLKILVIEMSVLLYVSQKLIVARHSLRLLIYVLLKKVIFIKMRQNLNFETWRIEGECFQESLIIPLNSTSSHSHLRQQ